MPTRRRTSSPPLYRRRPARIVRFDPSLPQSQWPEGVRLQGGNSYAFYFRDKMWLIDPGDIIVYEGYNVSVMSSAEFEATFEEVK